MYPPKFFLFSLGRCPVKLIGRANVPGEGAGGICLYIIRDTGVRKKVRPEIEEGTSRETEKKRFNKSFVFNLKP